MSLNVISMGISECSLHVPLDAADDFMFSIHGLKSIGYVQLIISPTYTQPRRAPKKSRPPPESKGDVADNKAATAVAIAVVVLAAAFCLPYLSHSPISLRSIAK